MTDYAKMSPALARAHGVNALLDYELRVKQFARALRKSFEDGLAAIPQPTVIGLNKRDADILRRGIANTLAEAHRWN